MKFLDNMSDRQRKATALNCAFIESVIALTLSIIALVTDDASVWFSAMFAVVMGAAAWVVFTPTLED